MCRLDLGRKSPKVIVLWLKLSNISFKNHKNPLLADGKDSPLKPPPEDFATTPRALLFKKSFTLPLYKIVAAHYFISAFERSVTETLDPDLFARRFVITHSRL